MLRDAETGLGLCTRWTLAAAAGIALTSAAVAAPPPGAPALDDPAGELLPPQYPPDAEIPRSLTPEEREWIRRHPITVPDEGLRGPNPAPEGPIYCPPEYAPMEGILVSWRGSIAWLDLLTTMAREITAGRPGGGGYGTVWVVVDSATTQNSATTRLVNGGVDMSRVRFAVRTTDSIWIRDYGPRYIYQGQVRSIVNHTYNRPRPNDNAFPVFYGGLRRHGVFNIPLVHGGGNFHLDGQDNGFATSLITAENPGLTSQQVIAHWFNFQNLTTTLLPAFPTTVDSTQHLDMWMQVIADDAVIISDFISNGTVGQNDARDVCNGAAADMASRGYTVHRIPARNIGGVHYTYTNVVMCNGVVLVPQYSNGTMQTHNAEAIATWQAALPEWRIVGVNCDAIVGSAGVMHCIVMHVPAHAGGESPTAFLRTQRSGEQLSPGAVVPIRWATDDDVGVLNNVEILLSHNGGQTYETLVAANQLNLGTFNWAVPNRHIRRARLRVIARDADGNTGHDSSPVDFRILGTCRADWDGDNAVNSSDISSFIQTWLADVQGGTLEADFTNSGTVNSQDISAFITAWLDAITNGC